MTTQRDPDRLLELFLEEGPEALPDRVIEAVRDDIHETDQRAVFGLRRIISMPRAFATAAVIAAVAIGGVAYLATRSQGPDVGSTPSPSALETALPQVMPAFHNNGAILVVGGGLRAINPATGNAAKGIHLPDARDAYEATWSPDGMQLAYAVPGGLFVVDVSTGQSRRIAYCGQEITACALAWSPDGSQIAVARYTSQLELIDPVTEDVTRLEAPSGTGQPTWSPDGTRIFFQAIEGYGTSDQIPRLYVMNRDGSDLTLLFEMEAGPNLSPDGSTIAYIAGTPVMVDGQELYALRLMLLGLDGSEPRELVEVGTCFCLGLGPDLTWSPDGATLALDVPGVSGEWGLYIVNADGTDFHRVANRIGTLAWRPVP